MQMLICVETATKWLFEDAQESELKQLSDSFIMHYSTAVPPKIDIVGFDQNPNRAMTFLKEVFQLISVTESVVWRHWQRFKGSNVYMSVWRRASCEPASTHVRVDTSTAANQIWHKRKLLFTICDAIFTWCHFSLFLNIISPFVSRSEIKWLAVMMCIFHHAILFSFFFPPFCDESKLCPCWGIVCG